MIEGTTFRGPDAARLDYIRGTLVFCAEELSKHQRPYADLLLPVLKALTEDIERNTQAELA